MSSNLSTYKFQLYQLIKHEWIWIATAASRNKQNDEKPYDEDFKLIHHWEVMHKICFFLFPLRWRIAKIVVIRKKVHSVIHNERRAPDVCMYTTFNYLRLLTTWNEENHWVTFFFISFIMIERTTMSWESLRVDKKVSRHFSRKILSFPLPDSRNILSTLSWRRVLIHSSDGHHNSTLLIPFLFSVMSFVLISFIVVKCFSCVS